MYKKTLLTALSAILVLVFFFFKFNPSNSCQLIKVIDGDTIKVKQNNKELTVRYIGIDSPELGNDECFATKAGQINQELLKDKKIRLELDTNHMDRFGRTLAYVFASDNQEEIMLNQKLLEMGAGKYYLDTVNLKYTKILTESAQQGRDNKQGLWHYCAPDPKKGCNIKGNLDKNDKRWYHLPSFRHYEQIVLNLDNGDQWFCTEDEAIKAGFNKARE